MLEAVEQLGLGTSEGMQAMVCNQHCIDQWVVELSKLEHDHLGLQDMSPVVKLVCSLMNLAVHGHIFCSALRLRPCYELLVEDIKEIVKHEQG